MGARNGLPLEGGGGEEGKVEEEKVAQLSGYSHVTKHAIP